MINKKDEFELDAPNFLEMVLADMDFDKAYLMYTTLQQKQAVLLIENLLKVQLLNQQYVLGFAPDIMTPPVLGQDLMFSFEHQQQQKPLEYVIAPEAESQERTNAEFDQQYDKFFSHTELDALEKFLDNLANPTALANPMDFYHQRPQVPLNLEFDTVFNLHTMKTSTVLAPAIKEEPLALFLYPHLLPTPHQLRQPLLNGGDSPQQRLESLEDEGARKRRRTLLKQLLTLEQKRLNHSHLEQKRRKLCKLAYERCLRLIIDIEKFNALPAKFDERPLKLKRARVNKDGLPNLLKHTALIRILNEITTIQLKNDRLRQLLEYK